MKSALAFLFVCGLLARVAHGEVTISLGTIVVPTNTNSATFDIMVSGGDTVTDMVAYFEVAGGGPLYGGTNGPKITALDFGAGTIWAASTNGFTVTNTAPYPTQFQEISLNGNTTSSQAVASGKLCRVTVDTTGFTNGDFTFKMTSVYDGGSTEFLNGTTPVVSRITNGILRVSAAPRPAAVAPPVTLQRLGSGNIQLSFPTVSGLNYTVQWGSNLVAPWTALSTLPGTGSSLVWTDDGSLTGSSPDRVSRRFYRVFVVQAP